MFVFMLATCDADGTVDKTPEAIAARSGMPIEAVEKGLRVLEQPDRRSRSADMAGRRICRIDEHRDWGWFIVNHARYRTLVDEDARREQNRVAAQKYRQVVAAQRPSSSVIKNHHSSAQAEAEAEAEAVGVSVASGVEGCEVAVTSPSTARKISRDELAATTHGLRAEVEHAAELALEQQLALTPTPKPRRQPRTRLPIDELFLAGLQRDFPEVDVPRARDEYLNHVQSDRHKDQRLGLRNWIRRDVDNGWNRRNGSADREEKLRQWADEEK